MTDSKHRENVRVVALDQISGAKSTCGKNGCRRAGRHRTSTDGWTSAPKRKPQRPQAAPPVGNLNLQSFVSLPASALRRSAFSQAEPPNRHFKGEMRTKH